MDKSHQHGEPSLPRSLREPEDVVRELSAIGTSPVIRILRDALGSTTPLFLVGGLVRDAFYGDRAEDLDVTTPLPIEEVFSRCIKAGIRTVETGIQHGTVLAVIEEQHVEITAFRKPSDRDHHTLAGTIEEDLSGRDFTFNAIAFDLLRSTVVDPFGGVDDLRAHTVRAVGSAEARFSEDPLRILRMIRFGPASGRDVAQDCKEAAKDSGALLERVSPERIKSELDKILMSDGPAAFRMMLELGLLPYTVPELIPAVGCEQNEFHIHDVFDHTMWVLERCPLDLTLRWSAIFHDVGKPHTVSIGEGGRRHFYRHEIVSAEQSEQRMEVLRFSNDDRKRIVSIVRHHMRPIDCGPTGIRRLLRDLGEDFERWYQFKFADAPPIVPEAEVQAAMQRFRNQVDVEIERQQRTNGDRLALDGNDIMALGIPAGPRIGKILRALQEIVIETPEENNRETLLDRAKSLVHSGN